MKKELIKYFKSLGIEVYTNTKARGHQGFFLSCADRVTRLNKFGGSLCHNRIDISKNTKEERIIPTLLHEFAHFIHNKVEPDMLKMGGSIETLFCISKSEKIFFQELLQVTNFVDENSLCLKLKTQKDQIKRKIKILESEIKKNYPNFMRSKKFKEFNKYIKKSKAKYLLKYDRVKFISPFLRREEALSIDNLEYDFPDMPRAFCAYIRLKSAQRKQTRISSRINRLGKYYSKPTELFARFVEGVYIDEVRVCAIAPHTSQRFFELLEMGYYFELKEVFQLISGRNTEITDLSVKYFCATR